jgi:hypothetical protein
MRRIYRSRRDEATEQWRKLYVTEQNIFFFLFTIVRVTISGRVREVGPVTCMCKTRNSRKHLS